MTRLSLRAPLAAALFTAALFGTCAAAEEGFVFPAQNPASISVQEEDSASCRPFGPRFSQRMQRYQLCIANNQRKALAQKDWRQQAGYQSK